jgi:hypothetical protein
MTSPTGQSTAGSGMATENGNSSPTMNNWPDISKLFQIDEGNLFRDPDTRSGSTPDPSPVSSTAVHTVTLLNGVTLVTKGSFNVEAGSQTGTWFQNFSDKPATIKFSGNGRWSYENGIYYTASGNSSAKLANNYNQGSLILYRQTTHTTEYIGQEKEITLSPIELVYFRCNDDVFLDNMGSLTIDWELQKLGS